MMNRDKIHTVGMLTSGGDCPGLNVVIRAVTKALEPEGIEVIGILEGFKGLIENRVMRLDAMQMSGLLTVGGTILRTSRDKPHKMPTPDGGTRDMTGAAVETCRRLNLDCLICLGGGGTQKNAYRLAKEGVNVITAPKTIDNDVYGTDICFGFDTAMNVATEAIDRLHTTASSHHRVMVVDIMGHNAGWLALGSGIAGGADVILIPEIPYNLDIVAASLLARMRKGKMFSIVAMAEGARAIGEPLLDEANERKKKRDKTEEHTKEPVSAILAEHLEEVSGLETRVTSLGYLQRGGIPSPTDRLLSTNYGVKVAEMVLNKQFNCMAALRASDYVAVPLEEVIKQRRTVPPDHDWIKTARAVTTCLGDEMPHGFKG